MGERERFELWAQSCPTQVFSLARMTHNSLYYRNHKTQAAWEAWEYRASLPQPSLPQENADSLNTNSVVGDGLKTTPSAGQTEEK